MLGRTPGNIVAIRPMGDGVIDLWEDCDDSNIADNDGCSYWGEVETGWECSSEPSICTLCGDGVVEASEECDDGG